MEQSTASDPPRGEKSAAVSRPTRGRSIGSVVCLVLAGVLMTPAAVAYWGQRTLNDTQRYVETVRPLVNSSEVQDVLATTVTDAIQKQVDVEEILSDVFADVIVDRPRLERLVGPLSAAVNGAIERQVREFLASDVFADLWIRVNTRAQQALQRILEGEPSGAVALEGDQVVLDVSELIEEVKQRLVDRGLSFVENVPIPETDRQIVLLDAPQLKQLRTIYAFGNPLARWLLPLVGLLFVLAFALSRRKPRMTVAIGVVIAVNAVLIALGLSVGRQLFANELSGTTFGPASGAFYETMLAYLQRGQKVVLWLGLTLVVTGWFTGSGNLGTAVRTTIVGGLEQVGSAARTDQLRGAAGWVSANIRWLRVAAVGLGTVVLFWGNDISPSRWWWSLALVLVLLALLQILVGAARDGEEDEPARSGRAVGDAAP